MSLLRRKRYEDMSKEEAILDANRQRLLQEVADYNANLKQMAKKSNALNQTLNAAGGAGGGSHSHSYTPGGGGGSYKGMASAGSFTSYESHTVRSHVDVGELIDHAVKEASKEFKLTVEAMQEQIDELWEYIRELEDE